MNKCRVCGKILPGDPLLHFSGQVRGAQGLPDRENKDEGISFSVRECPACHVVQLDSPPVPYFREVIRTAGLSPEMQEFRFAQFSGFVQENSLQGKKVLECGCGCGEYLSIMEKMVFSAYGIDGSAANIEKCLAKGLHGEKLYFETGREQIEEAPFDAFYMLNFLEHIPDLTSYLQGIWHNLKENAAGLVEVPNFDMMLEHSFFAEFIADHLYYFTGKSLQNILECNGFKVVKKEKLFHDYILSMQVIKTWEKKEYGWDKEEKEPLCDLRKMAEAEKRFIKEFSLLLSCGEKCAVWGGSHQTFFLLALLEAEEKSLLHSKVRFVADSAPFKQGKITPATHIDIVAPEKIMEEKIDTLFVIAGGYSDEICRMAREKMMFTGKMYVLRASGLEMVQ